MSYWMDRISINDHGQMIIRAIDPIAKALGETVKLSAESDERLKQIDRRIELINTWNSLDTASQTKYGTLPDYINTIMGE